MKITTRMHQEIINLHKKGWTRLEIAKKFGVTPSTISYHLDPTSKEKKRVSIKNFREKLRK